MRYTVVSKPFDILCTRDAEAAANTPRDIRNKKKMRLFFSNDETAIFYPFIILYDLKAQIDPAHEAPLPPDRPSSCE